jgi:uncharacterized metal-binding protein
MEVKKMSDDCCSQTKNIMILPCSGGSNVGQTANQAAVELTREGFGKMYCLAGIGGALNSFVQSAKDVEEMIVIDGCDIACGRACLEKAGIPVKKHVIVTQLDIKKNSDLTLNPDDTAAMKHAVKLSFKYPVKFSFNSPKQLSPANRARSKILDTPCC